MRTYAHVLAAIVIAATTVGPVSAATAPVAPNTIIAQAGATSTTVTGTVKDDQGVPIAGATITLRGPHNYSATTDATGSFNVASVNAGIYAVTVVRAGYDTARDEITVLAGQPQTLQATLHIATLTSLRTIASVRAVGRGTFNTTTAAVNTVTAQQFADQGTPQITRVLNEVPGLQISLPSGSANAAVPGAITFPNIRGALSFETASLIDGHPLSVGRFGNYVTTFLNSATFGGVEVVKGPGAMAPQVNNAIGGTINLRTKDPTPNIDANVNVGFTNHGGTYTTLGISDTILNNRLGFVAVVGNVDDPSALNNYQAYYVPNGGIVTVGGKTSQLGFNDNPVQVSNTVSSTFSQLGLVACCYNVQGQYNSTNELVKLRYKLSNATTATFTYLGGQTYADQNGNTSSQILGQFQPNAVNPSVPYNGPLNNQPLTVTNIHPGSLDREVNNEPILQGEVRTTLGNDTILGRFYHAGIDRLIYQGGASPSAPTVVQQTLYGTDFGSKGVFNGVSVPVTFFDWFQQSEIDSLSGISFEYDHPMNNNDVTFSFDQTNSKTTAYTQSPFVTVTAGGASAVAGTPSVSIPSGSGQLFTTLLLRDRFTVNDKLSGTLSLYDNLYRNTVPTFCFTPATPATAAPCAVDGSNAIFGTTNSSHFDQRLGLEYRPKADLAVRFAMGSAIAPPYLNLLTQVPTVSCRGGCPTGATRSLNGGNLLPETAFGYDIGFDKRLKDNVTFVSFDAYLTNLFNHFTSATYLDPNLCTTTFPYPGTGCPAAGVPLYNTYQTNLSNARFQGLELQIRHVPAVGFGYNLSGSTQRGYAYNIPNSFYCSPNVYKAGKPCIPANYDTNLAVVPNQNFTGGGLGNSIFGGPFNGFGFGGLSNQSIPYLQGNAEISYRWSNGAQALLGETLYGKNNSAYAPPFGIGYASVRYPINKSFTIQLSGDNIFNALNGLFPTSGGGVPVPLVSGPNYGAAGVPAQAGSTENVYGPATYRFELRFKMPEAGAPANP